MNYQKEEWVVVIRGLLWEYEVDDPNWIHVVVGSMRVTANIQTQFKSLMYFEIEKAFDTI